MNTSTRTNKSVLLFLASQDFNEQEYLLISSQLEKAGLKVFIVSDANSICVGSSKLKVKNDVQLHNANHNNFGGFVLIGGNGIKNYFDNKKLHSLGRAFIQNNKPVGAICLAPVLLAKADLLSGNATCYPENRIDLENEGIEYLDAPVVINKKIITGQGPSSAEEFAKAFLHELLKK